MKKSQIIRVAIDEYYNYVVIIDGVEKDLKDLAVMIKVARKAICRRAYNGDITADWDSAEQILDEIQDLYDIQPQPSDKDYWVEVIYDLMERYDSSPGAIPIHRLLDL